MARNKQGSDSVVKSIPSSESGHQTECITKSGKVYIISNNPLKSKYTLWEVLENGYRRLCSSENPLEFDSIIYKI